MSVLSMDDVGAIDGWDFFESLGITEEDIFVCNDCHWQGAGKFLKNKKHCPRCGGENAAPQDYNV